MNKLITQGYIKDLHYFTKKALRALSKLDDESNGEDFWNSPAKKPVDKLCSLINSMEKYLKAEGELKMISKKGELRTSPNKMAPNEFQDVSKSDVEDQTLPLTNLTSLSIKRGDILVIYIECGRMTPQNVTRRLLTVKEITEETFIPLKKRDIKILFIPMRDGHPYITFGKIELDTTKEKLNEPKSTSIVSMELTEAINATNG